MQGKRQVKSKMKKLTNSFSFFLLETVILGFTSYTSPAFAEEIKPVYVYEDALVSGSLLTFAYKPESLYEAKCRPGHITDIILKHGEEITHIAAGDTEQWLIDKAKVNGTTHVYVKPIREGIETNLIINTARHSYRLLLKSADSYHAIVSWTFADEDKAVQEKEIQKEALRLAAPSHRLNFRYIIKHDNSSQANPLPKAVFDDGLHTYIKMPDSSSYDLPVLYRVEENKSLTLINFRVKNNLFITDTLISHGRLVFAKNVAIDFFAAKQKAGF